MTPRLTTRSHYVALLYAMAAGSAAAAAEAKQTLFASPSKLSTGYGLNLAGALPLAPHPVQTVTLYNYLYNFRRLQRRRSQSLPFLSAAFYSFLACFFDFLCSVAGPPVSGRTSRTATAASNAAAASAAAASAASRSCSRICKSFPLELESKVHSTSRNTRRSYSFQECGSGSKTQTQLLVRPRALARRSETNERQRRCKSAAAC